MTESERWITDAIEHLRSARDLLVTADAPRAADKVRAALKSAEGALRHAHGRQYRQTEAPQGDRPVYEGDEPDEERHGVYDDGPQDTRDL